MHLQHLTLSAIIALTSVGQTAFAATTPDPDGTTPVTRIQLVQAMVLSVYSTDSITSCLRELSPSRYRLLFTDVTIDEAYAPALCMAMRTKIVNGYADGSFRPHQTVTFVEAAKIISRAMALAPAAGNPEGSPWYLNYVRSLERLNAIPLSVTRLDEPMRENDLDEILSRLRNALTNRASRTYEDLTRKYAAPSR